MPMMWTLALCHCASRRRVRWPVLLVPACCVDQVSVARTLAVHIWMCHGDPSTVSAGWSLSVGSTPSLHVGLVNCITCCWSKGGKHAATAEWVVCIQVQLTSWGLEANWWSWAKLSWSGLLCCCIAHLATASASSFHACPWCPLTSWIVTCLLNHRPRAQHSCAKSLLDLHVVTAVATVLLSDKSGRMHALVFSASTPLKNMKVRWDYEIPNIWEVIKFHDSSHHQPDISLTIINHY